MTRGGPYGRDGFNAGTFHLGDSDRVITTARTEETATDNHEGMVILVRECCVIEGAGLLGS